MPIVSSYILHVQGVLFSHIKGNSFSKNRPIRKFRAISGIGIMDPLAPYYTVEMILCTLAGFLLSVLLKNKERFRCMLLACT